MPSQLNIPSDIHRYCFTEAVAVPTVRHRPAITEDNILITTADILIITVDTIMEDITSLVEEDTNCNRLATEVDNKLAEVVAIQNHTKAEGNSMKDIRSFSMQLL